MKEENFKEKNSRRTWGCEENKKSTFGDRCVFLCWEYSWAMAQKMNRHCSGSNFLKMINKA